MTKKSNAIIKQFLKDLGLELKRVRAEKNLSIEEAAALAELYNLSIIERVERGKKNINFKYVRLINAYNQKVIVKLEDRNDD